MCADARCAVQGTSVRIPTSVLTFYDSLACRFARYYWPVRPKLLCKAVNDRFTASRDANRRVYHILYIGLICDSGR